MFDMTAIIEQVATSGGVRNDGIGYEDGQGGVAASGSSRELRV